MVVDSDQTARSISGCPVMKRTAAVSPHRRLVKLPPNVRTQGKIRCDSLMIGHFCWPHIHS